MRLDGNLKVFGLAGLVPAIHNERYRRWSGPGWAPEQVRRRWEGTGDGPAGGLQHGAAGFITVHPSYLLRLPDEAAKTAEFDRFVRDLAQAWSLAQAA